MSQHHVTALPTIEVAGTTDLQLQQVNQCVSVYVGISNHPTCIDNAPTKNHEWSKLEEAGHVYFNTDDDERISKGDQLDNMKTECANISVQQRQSIFNTEVPNADRKADTAARQQTYVFGANPFLADNKVPWNYAECTMQNFVSCKNRQEKISQFFADFFCGVKERNSLSLSVTRKSHIISCLSYHLEISGQIIDTCSQE